MHAPEFEAISYEFEGKLREVRRLIADSVIVSDEQEQLIACLTRLLRLSDQLGSQLRGELLGRDALPMPTAEFLDELRAELHMLAAGTQR